MKKISLFCLFLLAVSLLTGQQFYLDSIYDEKDPEFTSKYYYNNDFSLKQVVFETEVDEYAYINENLFLINKYKKEDKEHFEVRETQLSNGQLSVYSIFEVEGDVLIEVERDSYTYEEGLLTGHNHFDFFSLGGQPIKFQFQYDEEYDYDENGEVIYYKLQDLMYRFKERFSIRENGVLKKEYLESNDAGYQLFDTTYFNTDIPENGWISHSVSAGGYGGEFYDNVCDSIFHFTNGSTNRKVIKRAPYCTTYNNIRYSDTIHSISSLIPFEYVEHGFLDENLNELSKFVSYTYEIDSSQMNDGIYVTLLTINSYDANNMIFSSKVRKEFYRTTPDLGQFTWFIDENGDARITFFPNPVGVGSTVNVLIEKLAFDKIDIVDHTGALVSTHKVDEVTNSIAITSPFDPGSYFLVGYKDGKHVDTQTLIVSN